MHVLTFNPQEPRTLKGAIASLCGFVVRENASESNDLEIVLW